MRPHPLSRTGILPLSAMTLAVSLLFSISASADWRAQAGAETGGPGWRIGHIGLPHYQPERSSLERLQNEGRDEPWRQGLRFEGAIQLNSQWQADGSLDAYPASKGYEMRGRLLRDIGRGLSIGPEASYEADQDQNAQQLGVAIRSFNSLPGFESTFRGGLEQSDDDERGFYVGLEFSRDF
jgi:hypothetical protein